MSINLKKLTQYVNPFSDIEFKDWALVNNENFYNAEELRQKGFLQYRDKNETNENKEVKYQEYVRLNQQGLNSKKREKIEESKGLVKFIDSLVNLPA